VIHFILNKYDLKTKKTCNITLFYFLFCCQIQPHSKPRRLDFMPLFTKMFGAIENKIYFIPFWKIDTQLYACVVVHSDIGTAYKISRAQWWMNFYIKHNAAALDQWSLMLINFWSISTMIIVEKTITKKYFWVTADFQLTPLSTRHLLKFVSLFQKSYFKRRRSWEQNLVGPSLDAPYWFFQLLVYDIVRKIRQKSH